MRLSWGMSWTRSAVIVAAWWAVPVAVGLLINAAISRSLPADATDAPITPLENHAELFFSAVMVVVPIVLPPAAAYVHRSWKVLVVMIALPVLFAVGTAVVFLLALSSGGGHMGGTSDANAAARRPLVHRGPRPTLGPLSDVSRPGNSRRPPAP